MDYGEVILKLKEFKAERGMTNEQLAEKSGVSLGTVNKLFAGSIGSIKLGTLLSLAEALGIDPTELLLKRDAREDEGENFGYVRVAAATPEIRVADVEFNARGIIAEAQRAASDGVKVLVLPELSLTGYTCGDLFYQPALLSAAERAAVTIAKRTAGLGLVLVFGLPVRRDGHIYNCAAVAANGSLLGLVPKKNLPNYNEFYDKRQFSEGPDGNGTASVGGVKCPFGTRLLFENELMPEMVLGVEICEDLWVASAPSVGLCAAGATMIANLSCSDETIGKAEYRRNLVSMQSAKNYCAYIYANAGEGESTQDMVFSGHSMVCDSGKILAETALFENGVACAEVDLGYINFDRSKFTRPREADGYERVKFSLPVGRVELRRKYSRAPFVPSDRGELNSRAELILNMQAHGLKKRLSHIRCRDVVIGVSGGLDSTLALLVCTRAFDLLGLPRAGIHAVTMPCFGTTGRTLNNSLRLMDLLGTSAMTVDIKESVGVHFRDIGHDPSVTDVTYENSQARERTQVLMDLANKFGGIVVGTGDLSELALGWATYNGDHMSMYAVNASVPKTLIRYLVGFEAARIGGEVQNVLSDVLATPVSPELLPDKNGEIVQKTEDIVGPYELHDFFLYHMLRSGFPPKKIYYIAKKTFEGVYGGETILKWLGVFVRRFFSQQFKRSCMPDSVKIGSVTLSPRGDWRMPSDAVAGVWLDEIEQIRRTGL